MVGHRGFVGIQDAERDNAAGRAASPRGSARAPKVVTSDTIVPKDALSEQLSLAKNNLIDFKTLPNESYFKHPYFGLLNVNMSLKFLVIHTLHHLKIVRDIVK